MRALLFVLMSFLAISCVKVNSTQEDNCIKYNILYGYTGNKNLRDKLQKQELSIVKDSTKTANFNNIQVFSVHVQNEHITDLISSDSMSICFGKDSIYVQKNNEYVFRFKINE